MLYHLALRLVRISKAYVLLRSASLELHSSYHVITQEGND